MSAGDEGIGMIVIQGGVRVRLFAVCDAYGCADQARKALDSKWFETATFDDGVWTVDRVELAHWLSLIAPGDGAARYKLGHLYDAELRLRHADFGA